MNKDQIKGRVEEQTGKLERKAGDVLGRPDLHDKGAGRELKGKVQKTFGDVKNKIGKAIDS